MEVHHRIGSRQQAHTTMNDIDEDLLLAWLAQELEPICEAEPEVLAKYVRALLKDDAEHENPRTHCVNELRDFLRENTDAFVENLFDAIETGSYKSAATYEDEGENEDDEDGESWRRRDNDSEDEEEESSNRRRNWQSTGDDEDSGAHKHRRLDDAGSRAQGLRPQSYTDRDHRGSGFGNDKRQMGRSSRGSGGLGGDHGGNRGGGRFGPERGYGHDGGRRWQDGGDRSSNFPAGGPPMMGQWRGQGGMPGMVGAYGGGMGWGGRDNMGYGGGYGVGWMPGHGGPGMDMYRMQHPPMMGGGGGYYDNGPGNWGNQASAGPPMPRVNALLGQDTRGEMEDSNGADSARPPVPAPPPGRPPPVDTHLMDGSPMNRDRRGGGWTPHGSQCTLLCTGIPTYAKEVELYTHFIKFGKIVKLLLRRLADNAIGTPNQGKVYNECLVQFVEAESCRKCLNNPSSVLGNRFIKLFPANHDLVPAGEVEEILEKGEEVYEGSLNDQAEGLWASIEGGRGGRGRGRGERGRGRGRGRTGRGWLGGAHTSSYCHEQGLEVSADGEDATGGSAVGASGSGAVGMESTVGNSSGDGSEGGVELRKKTPTHAQLEKERLRGMVLQQHNDLRTLRQQAESIWRKKEDLLQGQIDQFRAMMSKLEALPASAGEDKGKMMETLEGKIMAVQSSLRDLRRQQETGVLPRGEGVDEAGGRGVGAARGGYRGAGGRYAARGRGRGRGRSYVGINKSIDLRSKSLLVSNAPQELRESAHQHFSGFGKVMKIAPSDESSDLLVEFASRRDAERAIRKAGLFQGQSLSLAWNEEPPTTMGSVSGSVTSTGSSGAVVSNAIPADIPTMSVTSQNEGETA